MAELSTWCGDLAHVAPDEVVLQHYQDAVDAEQSRSPQENQLLHRLEHRLNNPHQPKMR